MIFNHPTNKQNLVYMTRTRVKADEDTYPISMITMHLNEALDEYVTRALAVSTTWEFDDIRYNDLPIATATTEVGRRDYEFNESFLKVDRVQLDYAGNGQFTDVPMVNEQKVNDLQSSSENGTPTYCWVSGGVLYFNIPFIEALTMRVFYTRNAQRFNEDDTDIEPGIPRIFHPYLSLKAAHTFAVQENLKNEPGIRRLLELKEIEVDEFLSRRGSKPRMTVVNNKVMK